MTYFRIAALALFTSTALAGAPQAQTVDAKQIDDTVAAMFAKVSPEWKARTVLDETQRICTEKRNAVSNAEANLIQERELKSVVMPADGKFLGDWKKGFDVANSGRGWQFSDPAGTVAGGNCYACHQMDPKELSFGTLGPSLMAYGRERKSDPEAMKMAWTKIYNSQAVVACSNMPRFGSLKVLNEQQIKDVMAYLFDPESPVNK